MSKTASTLASMNGVIPEQTPIAGIIEDTQPIRGVVRDDVRAFGTINEAALIKGTVSKISVFRGKLQFPNNLTIQLDGVDLYDPETYEEQVDESHIFYAINRKDGSSYFAKRISLSDGSEAGEVSASLPRPIDLTNLDYN